MPKTRIQVYADDEIKHRIELAAAKRHVAVTEYCLDAIVQQLADDAVLEEMEITIPVKAASHEDLWDRLRDLHDRILAERGGEYITDVDDIIEQMRSERDDELLGMY